MVNIYKFVLKFEHVQTIRCKAIKILDIQIQDGKPVLWVVTRDDAEERNVGIVMQGTGTGVFASYRTLVPVSTTQINGYVWHWFTDFNFNYEER